MPPRRRIPFSDYPRDAATADRISSAVERATRDHGLTRGVGRWTPYRVTESAHLHAHGMVVSLDDYSGMPFVETVVGVPWYQYRARLRCDDDDLYAVVRPPIDGYEDYNRRFLGLGRAGLLHLESTNADLEVARSLKDQAPAFDALVAAARRAGGVLIHPYMAIEPVWELAEALAREADVPVRVLGPLPRVTRLANDKARFSKLVDRLLGTDALARTLTTADPATMAELVRELARECDAVALKMPSCASGMGNHILDGRSVRRKPQREVRDLVHRFLEDKRWDGEEVLVVQWHRDVIESPSAQCWIPPLDGGEPQVEEVYQQLLVGEQRIFEGSVISALPVAIRQDFMRKSWLICKVFQLLGYVGRCSFDALVVGPSLEAARVKFVECNGRWGGTSTPMHLMNRVFGDFRGVSYRAQDYVDERLIGLGFPDLLELFGDTLYDRRSGRGRVLLYNVGGVPDHGKFDIVVTGPTYADIAHFIRERIPDRIARYLRRRPT